MKSTNSAVTIYDIAKEAGVSGSTVSRIINHKSGYSEKTRKKVETLLEKYGYTPNETARGLVLQSSRMVGILIVDVRYSHYTDMAYIMEKELSKAGYMSLIINTGITDEKKVIAIKRLAERKVDGLLLVGSTFQCEAVRNELEHVFTDTPIVIANGYLDLPNVKGVLVDECNGVSECIRLMQRKGHHKIAFIIPNHTVSNLDKKRGFETAVREGGCPECADWLYEVSTSVENGYNVTKKILEEHPDVEGLMFCEDEAAVGGVRALLDCGKRVPEEVAVIGVDDTRYCEISNPRLTALNNMMQKMGLEATRILLGCMSGQSLPEKIMLFSKIVERETT